MSNKSQDKKSFEVMNYTFTGKDEAGNHTYEICFNQSLNAETDYIWNVIPKALNKHREAAKSEAEAQG